MKGSFKNDTMDETIFGENIKSTWRIFKVLDISDDTEWMTKYTLHDWLTKKQTRA